MYRFGLNFWQFYAYSIAEFSLRQVVVVTSGAFTFTSVHLPILAYHVCQLLFVLKLYSSLEVIFGR